ncbi:MAG: glycosyltransferase [Myxococcales bacterium]|nr:glycosyltransferase [Myxococcales bacterium]
MILHVACLPFPTHQGTQAAIASMLDASTRAGRPVHLLAYAHAAYELDAPYEIHRIPNFPEVRSVRSGPSWGKLALDARCIVEIRRLASRLQPIAIIAHHIEAALAALAARVAPVYYVAHTSLERELPVFMSRVPARPVRSIGRRLEKQVCRRAEGVAAVAPALATLLGESVRYLPVPWSRSAVSDRATRSEARLALGIAPDAEVCLYAGNLDPYQGWENLVEAIAMLRCSRRNAHLLIATASHPGPAREQAERLGVGSAVGFSGLESERARMLAHAASDVAWVPRRTEGGLPVKMLDAFARDLPVVAMQRATAGLPLRGACRIVSDDDPGALAAAAGSLFEDERAANALRDRAGRYLSVHHSSEWFSTALRHLLGDGVASAPARHGVPPPRAASALQVD